MKIKLLAFSIGATIAFGSLPAHAQTVLDAKLAQQETKQARDGVQYLDPDSPAAIAELKSIFNDAGWNEKNSPQLFKQLHTPQNKSTKIAPLAMVKSLGTEEMELESYFSHLGFNIIGTGDSKLFKIRLLNSEPQLTKVTTLTIKLVNEKGEQITTQQTRRFFGAETPDDHRDVLGGEATLSSAYEHVSRSKEVYAEGSAFVIFNDDSKVFKKVRVKYDRNALLGMLGKELGLPLSNKAATIASYPLVANKLEQANQLAQTQHFGTTSVGDFFEHTVEHPKDWRKSAPDQKYSVPGADGKIMVCLNRDYGDCDYPTVLAGGDYNDIPHVTIPFKGQITLPTYISRVLFKEDAELENNNVTPTDILVQGKDSFIDRLSYNNTNMKSIFAKYFKVEYHFNAADWMPVSVLSWDIPRNAGIFAKPGIFTRRADAFWIMNIGLEVNWMGNLEDAKTYFGVSEAEYNDITGYTSYIIASSQAPELPKDSAVYNQAPLQFSYSCLAKGTQILMPNGQSQSIEQFNVGDLVMGSSEFSTKKKEVLRVVDMSVGVEHLPMIKITTDKGQTLTLTESHPLVREGGMAAWALNVQQGDVIQTEQGLATITSYEKVDYKDNVYNLKLARVNGKQEEGETFVMYANGISVGDLAMQTENEVNTSKESVEDVLKRLPQEWHADYLNSLEIDKK
ncbi:hypothetical protein EXT48_04385 [Pseudoalteromonas sp. CO348]|uniref:Hint domain-containing protein n=1 Tax=Pseudoalteromonas TaxID=53246 RepID=UPI001023C506|nr:MULTISPECIES: Hint domain-containing protein [Pseudoalteromonas]MCG7538338.1 hypothetical protein [Pseudoalteromonas sp. OF7H-1]MCG9769728.1 hypothetical protein [Pseudoalteromonas piscicida]RZG08329.1 hypothetical protein EXT48_04385 [Pseudoalteromonas sp. CO348]